MSSRASRRTALAALLALASLAATQTCVRRAGNASRTPTADSSFAALALQRHRAPLEISVASGRLTYARYCSVCHGETGDGDGFNAYNVQSGYNVKPAAFSDSAWMASLRDSVALTAIRQGGPAVGKSAAMPPWGGTLGASEIADVWNFARSLVTPKRP